MPTYEVREIDGRLWVGYERYLYGFSTRQFYNTSPLKRRMAQQPRERMETNP